MDTYANDVAELVKALDLKSAIHIGHSTGGGELTRYVARHGKGRVAKAVLISSVPPLLVKSEKNPDGLPLAVFDQLRTGTGFHRSQFYSDITIPFYGFNRPGAEISQGIRDNWWRQGIMGGIKAQYDCIKALSETDFFDDLKSIDVPVLVMHGLHDQICPFESSGAKSVKLLKHGTLKTYPRSPHGMPTTHADQINADLLAFFKTDCCCGCLNLFPVFRITRTGNFVFRESLIRRRSPSIMQSSQRNTEAESYDPVFSSRVRSQSMNICSMGLS